MQQRQQPDTQYSLEEEVTTLPGIPMLLFLWIVYPLLNGYLIWTGLNQSTIAFVVLGALLALLWFILVGGFFTIEPNGSRAMVLFGKYKGTVKSNGFFWANPFLSKKPVSLRARTLNGEKLKVNDAMGNPIEIAAIIIWRVEDTYRACFDVENYEEYVRLQSETAVRHLASAHPYDAEDEHLSLRRNTDEISSALRSELQERLARAGVDVLEARLSHLAYAPEIANAMLRRQQAVAVIAARQKIVEGAVGMVEMALQQLERQETVTMTEEQKAQLVSNLLVVLCSEQSAQPVVNTSNG
jgi:regulator of protease activity HflC (stomatin/prohibitin superfamily)